MEETKGTFEDISKELQKCKENPYYFFTKYCKVNNNDFKTLLTEEQFNKKFFELQNGKRTKI